MFYVAALKHSPSKRKSISRPLRPLEGDFDSTGKSNAFLSNLNDSFPTFCQKFFTLIYDITREIDRFSEHQQRAKTIIFAFLMDFDVYLQYV